VVLDRRWVDPLCSYGSHYTVSQVKLKSLPATLSDLSSNVEHVAAAEDDNLVLKLDCSVALAASNWIVSGSVGYIFPYQLFEVNFTLKDFWYSIVAHASDHDG